MSRFVDALLATAEVNVGARARGLVTGEPDEPRRASWARVHAEASAIAAMLRSGRRGRPIGPGDAVAVLADDPALIAPTAQAVWLVGGSVTMLHQPTPRADLSRWAADTLRTLRMIDAAEVLLGPPFDTLSDTLAEHGISHVALAELFDNAGEAASPWPTVEDDTALLQLTSGSTAHPKAVRITHGNLWANATAMRTAAEIDSERDLVVSWLPLFHDMGMVGCLVLPMLLGVDAVLITPSRFLPRPTLWAELIGRYRATITAAPHFAYAITARRLSHVDDGELDLSSLRFALNGAEPVDPATVRDFVAAGSRFGLRPGCVVNAYGMAEATLGVSFSPLGRGLAVDSIDPGGLERYGKALPAPACSARDLVRLGPPLSGMEVDVVGESGTVLDEREVGELRVRGASVTAGYLTEDGPRSAVDADGWFATGDRGYLAEGEVVVCGRAKDVIIMGGRNLYPVDIERAAAEVPGVRPGNIAAVRLSGSGREHFAVVCESRGASDAEQVATLRKEVAARVLAEVGARPHAVLVLEPGALPKTPSGKLQRTALRSIVDSEVG